MPIIRSKTEADFFVMHNATAQDNSLSWEARGMLAYLLSKPEGWKTNMTDLARQSSAGRDKCYRVMDDLIAAGYVERVQRRDDGKIGGFDYFVYDRPRVVKSAINDPVLSDSPDTVLPDTVLPDTGNTDAYKEQSLERTDLEKTEKTPCFARETGAAFDAWNDMAAETGLPAVQIRSETRKKHLRCRLAECGGLEGWMMALAKVRASPFLTGKTKDWRADFDFVTRAAQFAKIMEGGYPPAQPNATQAALERMRAEA